MTAFLNTALKAGFKWMARGESKRFHRAMKSPRVAQDQTLATILRDQAQTEMGQTLGLNEKLTREEFRAKLPIAQFEGGLWSEWYHKQLASPERSILTPGGVRAWETTSGSSGPKKKIPYNSQMSASFERYFKIWAYDLLTKGPALESLKLFMSVSPGLRDSSDEVGFQDDSEYLSPALRWIVRRYLAAPLSLKSISDPDGFRDRVAVHLLLSRDLEIISVWHPSFFTLIWQHIVANRARLVAMLRSESNSAAIEAAELLSSREILLPESIWPNLNLVSAWDQGQSRVAAQQLAALFPNATFQGKGLLATEVAMTLPLIGIGTVPFLTETFFEFRDQNGDLFFLDELNVGETYEIIVTQRSGFLRYTLGDQVRVSSKLDSNLPILEFVSRLGDVSDLVGEKLSAAFLSEIETELQSEFGPHLYCLLPVQDPVPHYVVLFDANVSASKMAIWWDRTLSASFHFGYARKLGQLRPTRAVHASNLANDFMSYYSSRRNMKQGDIKLKNLIRTPSEASDVLQFINDSKARAHGIA